MRTAINKISSYITRVFTYMSQEPNLLVYCG